MAQGFVPGLVSSTSSLLCGVAAALRRAPGRPWEPPPLVRSDGGVPFQGQKDAPDRLFRRALPRAQEVAAFSPVTPRALHTAVETPRHLENRKRPLIQTGVFGYRGDPLPLNFKHTAGRPAAALLSLIGFDCKRFRD